MMIDINSFWHSNVQACRCAADAPALCNNNAIAFINQLQGKGYIWYDPAIVDHLSFQAGTLLGPAWLLAHEFGHNIQNANFTRPDGASVAAELEADCLSGYFLAGITCVGGASRLEISSVLAVACQSASMAWLDPSHGTCADRVWAIQQGLDGYFSGSLPLDRCKLFP